MSSPASHIPVPHLVQTCPPNPSPLYSRQPLLIYSTFTPSIPQQCLSFPLLTRTPPPYTTKDRNPPQRSYCAIHPRPPNKRIPLFQHPTITTRPPISRNLEPPAPANCQQHIHRRKICYRLCLKPGVGGAARGVELKANCGDGEDGDKGIDDVLI